MLHASRSLFTNLPINSKYVGAMMLKINVPKMIIRANIYRRKKARFVSNGPTRLLTETYIPIKYYYKFSKGIGVAERTRMVLQTNGRRAMLIFISTEPFRRGIIGKEYPPWKASSFF